MRDTMGTNCSFNCFGCGSRGATKGSASSESRRIKPEKGDSAYPAEYAVKISPARDTGGNPGAFVRILSVSRKGGAFPVTVVSPVKRSFKEKREIPDRSQSEPYAKMLGRWSGVRILVAAFGLSKQKNRNGKVRPRSSPVRANEVDLTITQPRFTEVQGTRNAAIHNDRDSGPKSKPLNSFAQLPQANMAMLTYTPWRPGKVHSFCSSEGEGIVSRGKVNIGEGEEYDAIISLSVLIMIMLCLLLSGKFFAIVCTCVWCYALPKVRSMSKLKAHGGVERDSKKPGKILSTENHKWSCG